MDKNKGLFITFEGIEGAGKTTAIKIVEYYLLLHNKEIVATREPGGTEIAEAIRQLLLDYYEEKMAEKTEILLMFASRAQHVAQIIRPALIEGKTVLCDRFTDASFAYQGGGRGIDEEQIAILEKWTHGDMQPDLTILLDVLPEKGLARARERGEQPDRIELEQLHFFTRVREAYLQRAEDNKNRYKIIDANVSLPEMEQSLIALMNEIFHLSS